MDIGRFSLSRLPRVEFGFGALSKTPELIRQFGGRCLIVTGARSFQGSRHWELLVDGLQKNSIEWLHFRVDGEPSPMLVNDAVRAFGESGVDVVLGIGGGSALDAAKAIAGLLRIGDDVMDYLEGVGPQLPYQGPAVPFIAVPTTAGTGSEATKNAVLSVQGEAGFKKSFRDDRLIAEYAVIDPDLLASCPPDVIAANGMDALTQLIESYVSTRATFYTDSLILDALRAVREGLIPWFEAQADATREARAKMAYAAFISGLSLAQTGLGSVHGLASPLGAFFPIPHGVVCGTLVAACTQVNIQAMLEREPRNPALAKYAKLGALFCARHFGDPSEARQALYARLEQLTERLRLPRLGDFGVQAQALDHIVANARGSSMRTNPIVLRDAEIRHCLEQRL